MRPWWQLPVPTLWEQASRAVGGSALPAQERVTVMSYTPDDGGSSISSTSPPAPEHVYDACRTRRGLGGLCYSRQPLPALGSTG